MADRQAMARKAQFVTLMDDPTSYFGDKTRLILFPNGQKGEIWITDANGRHGFRIKAGVGRAGLGLQVERFAGGTTMTISGNTKGERESLPQTDMDYIEIVQYDNTPKALAFKEWCRCQASPHFGYDDDKDANNRIAFDKGQQAAKEGKKIEECVRPDPEKHPKAANAFERGYWQQMAGMNDD